jgi:hypothetical protein
MTQGVCYPVVQGGKSAFEGTVYGKLSSNFGPSDVRSDGPIQQSTNNGPGWTTDLIDGDGTPCPAWQVHSEGTVSY